MVELAWDSVKDNGCSGLASYPYWAQVSTSSNFGSVVGGWYNSWTSDTFESKVVTGVSQGTVLYAHVRAAARG